jgi:hypothetical protein
MGREKSSRSCGTHNHHDFRPLITNDIGEHDLFNGSIAGTNLARASSLKSPLKSFSTE